MSTTVIENPSAKGCHGGRITQFWQDPAELGRVCYYEGERPSHPSAGVPVDQLAALRRAAGQAGRPRRGDARKVARFLAWRERHPNGLPDPSAPQHRYGSLVHGI